MEETQEPLNNRPWLFQKGNRANPGGRPKGSKSLKERARQYLMGLSDEEAEEYFAGLNKIDVWKMAEGNPKENTDITSGGKIIQIYGGASVQKHDSNQESVSTDQENKGS